MMNIRLDHRTQLRVVAALLLSLVSGAATSGQDQHQAPTASPDAAPQSSVQPAKNSRDDSFVIGNDDLLSINVWNEPDFNKQSLSLPVRSDGKISLPLIGEVQAAGLTPLQLQQDVATKLRSYFTQPDVTVIVLQINSQKFNILGRVARPGSYSLTATTTVLDAIAEAGGFQDFAKQKEVYILRKIPNGGQSRIPFNYKDAIRGKHPEQNIKLEPHDTIVVP